MNRIVATITRSTVDETNQLMYSAASVVTKELGLGTETRQQPTKTEPPWKIRLRKKINDWRADISCLEKMRQHELKQTTKKEYLRKKYHLEHKSIKVVQEELKQRVTATARKIERYEARIQQFQQNRQFRENQKQFYRDLDGKDNQETKIPDQAATTKFWSDLWDSPVEHNQKATWIQHVSTEFGGHKMTELTITTEMIKNHAKKMQNWTAPGRDEVHGYWIKHLPALHERLATQLNDLLIKSNVPQWLTEGRTSLLMKSKDKGPIPSNYRPITCLPTTYKLLTGVIASAMQEHLEQHGLLFEEQKGNKRNARGTKDQLLIDKAILKNSRSRKTNLHVAWIDYKKAFDSLPHSWIAKCLGMVGISENIQRFLCTAMLTWNTVLTVNGQEIGRVNIRRGIFQGDSLSPLLFIVSLLPLTVLLRKSGMGYQMSKTGTKVSHLLYMDDLKLYGKTRNELESLMNTVRIFSNDIKMEFGLDKCATLSVKRGKVISTEGIRLPDGNTVRSLQPNETYKYLGILQAEDIKHKEVKQSVRGEYIRRVRKVLKSKLNAGNTVQAMNTWAIPVVRYTAGIIDLDEGRTSRHRPENQKADDSIPCTASPK